MREIKFRAWDSKFLKMEAFELGRFISPIKFADLILMQYTGLHDKNGKEIYEGDIVEQFKGSEYSCKRFVDWRQDHCGFWLCFKDRPHVDLTEYREHLEVIGNIYENPELIKE